MIITTNQISKLSKLYVWSICLESLLFFIIADSFLLGTTANVSKILQLLVLVVVFFKILILNVVKIPSPLNNENKWFFYFFIFVILSGLFGLLSGAYKNEMYDATATQALRITFRPLFEYVILLYYFVYFAIMPKYFLSNSSSIGYFFKVFTSLFFIVLPCFPANFRPYCEPALVVNTDVRLDVSDVEFQNASRGNASRYFFRPNDAARESTSFRYW